MRRIIFIFLDGIGLGDNNPDVNPLARTVYPTLIDLLDGHSPTAETGRNSFNQAEFIPTDARLGVSFSKCDGADHNSNGNQRLKATRRALWSQTRRPDSLQEKEESEKTERGKGEDCERGNGIDCNLSQPSS